MPPMAYGCPVCGAMFPDKAHAFSHAEKHHPKEMGRLKLDWLRKQVDKAEGEDKQTAQMAFMDSITDYTRKYLTDASDFVSVYSIDEALGSVAMHEFFQRVCDCGYPRCQHGEPDPLIVEKVLKRAASP